jgi:hypothetical protein
VTGAISGSVPAGGTAPDDGAADQLIDIAGGWDWYCLYGADASPNSAPGEHKNDA